MLVPWSERTLHHLGSQRRIRSLAYTSVALYVLVCHPFALSAQRIAKSTAERTLNEDKQFQVAVAHYQAKEYQLAKADLQPLLVRFPENFEVNQLMGLVYVATGNDRMAVIFFRKASAVQPQATSVRVQLANSLLRLGDKLTAELEFKQALKLDPQNFEANRALAGFYTSTGKLSSAIPYLEMAQHADPSSYAVGRDLALAYFRTHDLSSAHDQAVKTLKTHNTAELHNLMAEIDEASASYVEAAKEYQQAAQMEPNEQYIFDWGYELLSHRTFEPARSVFAKGVRLHPDSIKLHLGLGAALYSLGKYEQAIQTFCNATDLDPTDPRAYLYLGRALNAPTPKIDEAVMRMQRFVKLQPKNALAYYYFAISLIAASRDQNLKPDYEKIEALLTRAIALGPASYEPHLQLATIYADQQKYDEAVTEYVDAISLQPNAPEPHYRLAQAYTRMGDKTRGEKELQRYQFLQAQMAAKNKREQREIQEFTFRAR